ncbi:MAG: TerB family tellurite resistance protein [Terriglobales bacterium]
MSISNWLQQLRSHAQQPSQETDTVRKIVNKLDQMPAEQARYIAAFAYILSRVARADMNVSAEEVAVMEQRVMSVGGLPEEQAVLVVQIAKTQATLFGGTENFLVTREFDNMATREQKLALLRCLFAVAAADNEISTVEDREIRLINDELQLTHMDFINARLEFKKYLSVLKDE